jgi:hypothetical protein
VRILFSTFGSLGDLHPYIAVALEAKRRGHEPIIATAAKYCAKIESLGVGFRAVRPDLPAEGDFGPLAKRVMDLKDGPRFLFQDVLSPALRDSYADLLAAAEDVDVIITHPAALAGPLVAQKLGKKWLSSVLAPISLWSKLTRPCRQRCRNSIFARAWPNLAHYHVRNGETWDGALDTGSGQIATRIGVNRWGHPMFEGQFSPYGTLALFSRHFARRSVTGREHTATGFCFYDAQGYGKSKRKLGANG